MIQPKDLRLPVQTWRDGQYESISRSVSSSKRFIGQCMPTGWGKSICLVGQAVTSGQRALILTSSKSLQDQYMRDFAGLGMLDIRGKSNYWCNAMQVGGEFYDGTPAKTVDLAPCQLGEECGLRLYGCSYYDKVREAKYKRLVSANYAAWISANLYTDGWGKFDLICCDEAHEAEDWVANMLSVRLPRCNANLIGTKFPNTTNVAVWGAWAARELPQVKAAVRIEKQAIKKGRKRKFVKLRTLQAFEHSLLRMKDMTGEWRVFPFDSYILFQPIWIHEYTESLLFNGANKVVFASSTIVPNTLNLLGITNHDMEFFSYPSTFPIERRPIYYYPVVKMHYGMTEEEEQIWISAVDSFISRRLDRKGLIHTVSYARMQKLLQYSRYASLMVASSPSSVGGNGILSANTILQSFRKSQTPSILIGPNWSTGIDLPYTDCQYTIIPKVPFPDIKDPLYIARSEDNPDYGWYNAGITLTQSIGRAMRAVDDMNETIILDKMFGSYTTTHKGYLPDWIHAAVKRVKDLPDPLERI